MNGKLVETRTQGCNGRIEAILRDEIDTRLWQNADERYWLATKLVLGCMIAAGVVILIAKVMP